jgi:tetratricopeptide (TPR) repeat protein
LRDRYFGLIDQIVDMTLKGQIRSKEQIYQMLVQGIEVGTGEVFEQCFIERLDTTQTQVKNASDEMKKAKAERVLRALKTIQNESERYQKEHQATAAIASITQALLTAESPERFLVFVRAMDLNQNQSLTLEQLKPLATALEQAAIAATNPELNRAIHQLTIGLRQGLADWQRLEGNLISWIYEQNSQMGFEGAPGQMGPWQLWARQVENPLLQTLFQTLNLNQSVSELVSRQSTSSLSDWVELAIVLQYAQRGLVTWFEKQPYNSQWGTKQAISTFLSFAVLWSQLSNGVNQSSLAEDDRLQLSQGCFQVVLQGLRAFSQRTYFPLYGGVFALFSNNLLRDTLNYLNEPLKQAEGTQEKARILTLLGYSLRAAGQLEQSQVFHQEALEIAQNAGDRPCEIANLNHLSRTYIAQKNFEDAISSSQRALVLARQVGDRLGEANALANLGYSEVLNARQQEQMDPDLLEIPVSYLKQGLKLLEQVGNSPLDSFTVGQSQALCYNSLGIAHVVMGQFQVALAYLIKGVESAQMAGDLYLQGLNYLFLGEVAYRLNDSDLALYASALGMYLLEQIQSSEWRMSASLLAILQGQLGEEGFKQALAKQRSKIIPFIGVDGYDHLPTLLEEYRRSL